jgi:hypothetical protein
MSRSKIVQACTLTLALLFSALAMGATVPFTYACSVASGFVSDPNQHVRVGYITVLKGLSTPSIVFAQDLTVAPPYQGPTPIYSYVSKASANTAAVVGIIENLQWNGGMNDPIQIDFYVSMNNASQLKYLTQQTLKSMKIDQLGWWIVDYDQDAKTWYEAAYPLSPPMISGTLANKTNPDLNVNVTPVTVSGVTLYKVSMRVAPPANLQQTLWFANSSVIRASKAWGMKLGTLPMPGM